VDVKHFLSLRGWGAAGIGEQHLRALGEDGVFLPCPPVTRGEEVSAEAMMSPRCQNHAVKDSLLHVQNAIMEAVVAAGAAESSRSLRGRAIIVAEGLAPKGSPDRFVTDRFVTENVVSIVLPAWRLAYHGSRVVRFGAKFA
jgi:hypothetical protein